jgi:uncharacterized membrane protein YgdD (TMEM256/DUF423 family)
VLGALAVALGAVGSHLLKKSLTPEMLQAYQTGAQYHMYHALALLSLGILYKRFPNQLMQWAGHLFIIGIILFSGSLYTLAFLEAAGTESLKGISKVTPIGGLAFIGGWICLLLGIRDGYRDGSSSSSSSRSSSRSNGHTTSSGALHHHQAE